MAAGEGFAGIRAAEGCLHPFFIRLTVENIPACEIAEIVCVVHRPETGSAEGVLEIFDGERRDRDCEKSGKSRAQKSADALIRKGVDGEGREKDQQGGNKSELDTHEGRFCNVLHSVMAEIVVENVEGNDVICGKRSALKEAAECDLACLVLHKTQNINEHDFKAENADDIRGGGADALENHAEKTVGKEFAGREGALCEKPGHLQVGEGCGDEQSRENDGKQHPGNNCVFFSRLNHKKPPVR